MRNDSLICRAIGFNAYALNNLFKQMHLSLYSLGLVFPIQFVIDECLYNNTFKQGEHTSDTVV